MLYHHRLGSTGTLMYLLSTPGSRVARPDNTKVPSIHVSNGALVRGTVQLLVPILGISARFGCARSNIDIILHPTTSAPPSARINHSRVRGGTEVQDGGRERASIACYPSCNQSLCRLPVDVTADGHPCRSQAFPHPAIGRCMQPKALIGLKRERQAESPAEPAC